MERCLKKIAGLGPEGVQAEYHYPKPSMAWALHQRASDMLSKGFEWTLKHGEPQNPSPARYKWPPLCCELYSEEDSMPNGDKVVRVFCKGQKYHKDRTIPVGEPAIGFAWGGEGYGKDYGTYNLTEMEEQGLDW